MTEHVPNGTSSRPGPKPDPYRAFVRQMFSEWSDRTFARYWKAHTRLLALKEHGVIDGDDGFKAVLARATRPNGSINVVKLDRISEAIALDWLASEYGDDPDHEAEGAR